MAGPTLTLPILQNWSCHNCGGCCRQHLIEITEEERQRILAQNWTAADGLPLGVSPVVPLTNLLGKTTGYRLAHQADGACIFLNEQGLCRIHAKFGEPAKPMPCRVYPYVFHPHGHGLTVSLRFSCPSVVANQGQPVPLQRAELQALSELAIPREFADRPPPRLSSAVQLDWPDLKIVLKTIDRELQDRQRPFLLRILRINTWMELLGHSSLEGVRGAKLQELLDLLVQAAEIDMPQLPTEISRPTRAAQLFFRLTCSVYCRKESMADLRASWRMRWKLFHAMIGFTRGVGYVPVLHDAFTPVLFSTLDAEFAPWSAEVDEMLTRYYRVKVQGLHFCGPAYYGLPVVEGWRHLLLELPVILWMARWLAVGAKRDRVQPADVGQALAIADHHHGFHPVLGYWSSRNRVRVLSQMNEISQLCLWYGR